MNLFEYPYVIITILAIIILLMMLIGLYFTLKSVKTAKGTAQKSFCGIGKIENDFERAVASRKNRSVVYISVSFDNVKRLYSDTVASRIHEQIKRILLNHFCVGTSGEICLHTNESFIALLDLDAEKTASCIDSCFGKINGIFANHGAVNVVRMNFGYHVTGSTDVSFKTALSRAKQACSIAEDRNILHYHWDSRGGKEFERKIQIENNIHNEIDNNRFFLEYQPILDSATNSIVGAEVLARLNSQTEGVLSPNLFLSAVNNVGLNEKFDYYIFEKNCKWIAGDKDSRTRYVYTINFSRSTLCDSKLAQNLTDILEKYALDHSCIAVEILEDKDLNDEERRAMIANISALKEKGIMVLLDDFGNGYTGFGDLTDLDINIVKIDKTITQNATTESGFVILRNIIKTAHDLGFRTLCEGIETDEHREAVARAGCDMLQGYYFHRPMPVTQLEALFKKQ